MSTAGQFLRFHCIGAMGTAVNLGTLVLAHAWAGLPVYPALMLSFSAAVLFNFLLIKQWTFRDRRWTPDIVLRQFVRFYSIAVTGLMGHMAVFFALHELAGMSDIYLAQLLAIVAVAPLHFFLNRAFTFPRPPTRSLGLVAE